MDYTFINDLRLLLEQSNIFKYSIVGAKACALALLLFKIIQTYISDVSLENPKFNGFLSIFAYALFIVSSDWIVNVIEQVFATVDTTMGHTPSNLYTELYDQAMIEYDKIFEGSEDWMDYIGIVLSSIMYVIQIALISILASACKIADLSMTASYLLTRVFFLQLMKFIFPFVIALSTIDMTKDLLGKWIKKYIGLFVLGIAYIGIIQFTELVQYALQQQFSMSNTDINKGAMISAYLYGLIITIIVTFSIKVKLFQKVTDWITSFFI